MSELLDRIHSREWFYTYELPDGGHTRTYHGGELDAIHETRWDMLRQCLGSRFGSDFSQLRALDLASHQGFFSVKLAQLGFGEVVGVEARASHVEDSRLIAEVYGLGAGETNVVTLLWSPAQPYGSLTTEARVDVNDEIRETDEDNNRYTAVIEVVEPEGEPVTITLTSEGALDGYRLNDGTGSSAQDILVGNGEMVNPVGELVARGFMSFDLSDIPAGAAIESAELRFYQKEIEGSPYEKLGNLVLEHVDYGAILGDSAYNTPALDTAVLDIETSPGAWYILSDPTIVAWVQSSLETGISRQQFRLQFSQETDGDGQEDWIAFQSGGSILGSRQAPQLTITYIP